jgi:hypothetical protein
MWSFKLVGPFQPLSPKSNICGTTKGVHYNGRRMARRALRVYECGYEGGNMQYATNREPLGNQVDLPTNMVDLAEQFLRL